MRFLRWHAIEVEALEYRMLLEIHSVDVIQIKALDISHRIVLKLPKYHARDA